MSYHGPQGAKLAPERKGSSAGQQLKVLRREAGLSARSVAQMLGMPRSSYEKIEDRRRKPTLPLDLVAKLVLALRPYHVAPEAVWRLADDAELDIFVRAWNSSTRKPLLRDRPTRQKKEVRETRPAIETRAREIFVQHAARRKRLSFGKNIRKLRKARGWRQQDLAGQIGVWQTAVSHWESYGRIPREATLRRLAEIFGCEVEALFTMKEGSEQT